MAFGTPYTIVSGASASGSSTLQVTVSHAAAVNDVLVIGAGNDAPGTTVSSVTDSQGNTYTPVESDYNQSDGLGVFVCKVTTALVSGTDWIKATYSTSTGAMTLNGRGISGADPNGVDVAIANDASTGTSPTSGSTGTLASAHEWAVAFLINGNGGGTPTSWTGGFTAQNTAHQTNNQYQTVADKVVTTNSALTAGATITSTHWAMILVTVQQAGTAKLKVDVSDTVTVTVTAGATRGHPVDVSDTVTATVTAAATRGRPIAVSETITASRTAGIIASAPGQFLIDVSKTVTASVTDAITQKKAIKVAETVTAAVTPGTHLAAVAGVDQVVSAPFTPALTQTGPSPGLGTPYTIVSGGAAKGSNTLQVTVEATSYPGDAIVVGVGVNSGAVSVQEVTDSQGNVYVLAGRDANQTDHIAVYVALNTIQLVSGIDWIKATYSGTGGAKTLNGRGCFWVSPSNAIDVTIANDSALGSAMSVGPSSALAQGSEWALVFAINSGGGGQPTNWTGGFTARDTAHVSSNQYQTVADQITSSPAALTAGATIASDTWAMVMVTLTAAPGTPYQIGVAETVTATVTANTASQGGLAVDATFTATVTDKTKLGAVLKASPSFTVNRTAGLSPPGSIQIDVSKTLTATVTAGVRRGFLIDVSQSLTMPVTTKFHLAAVAAVNDILSAAITTGPGSNSLLDVALNVTASDATSVSLGAVQVVAQWTESAVNSYGVSVLGINNTAGNCLAAFVGWSADDATRNPIMYVSDDAHNYWVPLEVSDPNSLQRGAIWVCTNAKVGDPQTGITTVTVSSTLPTAGLAFNIVELSNMPPFVVASGLESSAHSNAAESLTASGNATGVAWGFALYVSDGPTYAEPTRPWGALATGSTFNPGQTGSGQLDVGETVTANITAAISGGSSSPNKIDVSQTIIARWTPSLQVTTPTSGGNPSLLYAGANTGPDGTPKLSNFTGMLTGANGLPDMGPINCYKAFFSGGGSGVYTGTLGTNFSTNLTASDFSCLTLTQTQPGIFVFISWGVMMTQAQINTFVQSIPATDAHGNQTVVGFTFQSEPENAYPKFGLTGSQFVKDWIDQSTKIRNAEATFWPSGGGPKIILITSHYMVPYASDGGNPDALAGNYIPPAMSGGVRVTDVWGGDYYQNEDATDSSWSANGIIDNARWSGMISVVKSKSGISNPQFAICEYGIKPGKAPAGSVNSIRNTRMQADWNGVQKMFGPGGTVSSQPLFCWLWWQPTPGTIANTNYFTDGPTVATANNIISSAKVRGVNGK